MTNFFEGKIRRAPALVLTALLALLLAVPAGAQNLPQHMSHQGRILDSNLVPLGGMHEMTFTMYQNGQVVWSESITVAFENGYYTVIMGLDAELPVDAMADGQMELGVKVGKTPR